MVMYGMPTARVIAADDEGIAAALSHMQPLFGSLQPGESLSDLADRGPELVRQHVDAIAELLAEIDAFDAIELMRMREMPHSLEHHRESVANQLPAGIDLIALIAASRGRRETPRPQHDDQRAARAVEALHTHAVMVLTVGQIMILAEAERHGPLGKLSAEFVGHGVNVKVQQYAHIREKVDSALFSSDGLGSMLVDELGFSYEDFCKVRQGEQLHYQAGIDDVRERVDAAQRGAERAQNGDDASRSHAELRAALIDLMFLPGARASFTAADVADRSGVALAQVASVLETFSVPLGVEYDPVAATHKLLRGAGPLRDVSLVRDTDGHYITLGLPIGTDNFGRVVEAVLKAKPKVWSRYQKRRARVAEQFAFECLSELLGAEATYSNLKYRRPNPGVDVSDLGCEASDLSAISEPTEADALFLIEGVAVCVEVKAGSITSPARGGSVLRLARDLEDTVGNATAQAMRLEQLIRTNHGLWREDGSWLDLASVREIRSIVVCLEDMGPLGIALDELVRAEVISGSRFPWITTLHDLLVIAEVLERPAEFLLYLRRRTESEVSLNFAAVDELDLFMLFLSGGLYIEPDPDRIAEEFLGTRRPSPGDRRRHREGAVPTRVMTHTDPLDHWVYSLEGMWEVPVPKPRFDADARLLEIVDFLQVDKKPGWFRFSADLLHLSGDAQAELARAVVQLAAQTRRDGMPHSYFADYAGAWGRPGLFIGTRPASMSHRDAIEKLITYATLKKHQVRSDRALSVLLEVDGSICFVHFDAEPWAPDPLLDRLVEESGLTSLEAMARPVPPPRRRKPTTKKKRKPQRR